VGNTLDYERLINMVFRREVEMGKYDGLPPEFVEAMKKREAAIELFKRNLGNLHAVMAIFEKVNAIAASAVRVDYKTALDLYDTAYYGCHVEFTTAFADAIAAYESGNRSRTDAALVNLSAALDRYLKAVATAQAALDEARNNAAQPSDFNTVEANAKFVDALVDYAGAFDELGYADGAIIAAFKTLG
jgi:tetratricopeptide (TPR) repeat protein